jgi:hypothetical protein
MDTEDRKKPLGTAAGEAASASSSYLDDLARGLDDGTVSRRQALKWLGAGAVAFAIGPLFPEQAQALTKKQRRGCRRRGGLVCGDPPLRNQYCCPRGTTCSGAPAGCATSNCTFRGSCEDGFLFGCQDNNSCFCTRTVEGGIFCTQRSTVCVDAGTTCTNSTDCQAGWACARICCNPPLPPVCNPPCGIMLAGASGASSAEKSKLSGH